MLNGFQGEGQYLQSPQGFMFSIIYRGGGHVLHSPQGRGSCSPFPTGITEGGISHPQCLDTASCLFVLTLCLFIGCL